MRRKHETINGHNISVWDDGEKVIDRYVVVFLDEIDERGNVQYLSMNAFPFHPLGFGQHGEININAVAYRGRGGCFKRRIRFIDLPEDCKRAVMNDLRGE